MKLSEIRTEHVEALKSSGRFDADYYVERYPDVALTGIDPAVHFLWLGTRLGRVARWPRDVLQASDTSVLDVLFVDGTNGTSSTPYRVDRVAEGLSHAGLAVRCVRGDEIPQLAAEDIWARHVTFFRAPFWEGYQDFAWHMRLRGSTIIFDIDDLVFDEDVIPVIDGYKYLSDDEKLGYVRGVRAYREFLMFADFCTAPTDFLAEKIRSLGKKAYRVRNTLARHEISKFEAKIEADPVGRIFRIGYYSGSKTHQADFRNAADGLARFMSENNDVVFRLVGAFDLSEYPQLRRFMGRVGSPSRVEEIGLMPHSKMMEDQLKCDVIIAPLEVGNPFCEAKSELKFFEASLVRRPVIASPTATFRIATENGKYAVLADTPDEWLSAFREASVREYRHDLASDAQSYVIEQYAPEAAGRDAIPAYSGKP